MGGDGRLILYLDKIVSESGGSWPKDCTIREHEPGPRGTITTGTVSSSIGFVYLSVNQKHTGLGHKLFHPVQ